MTKDIIALLLGVLLGIVAGGVWLAFINAVFPEASGLFRLATTVSFIGLIAALAVLMTGDGNEWV